MSEREPSPEQTGSNRERLVGVAREALGEDVVEGLLHLELDDGDLLMALYAELLSAGVEDPEEFFKEKGL